MSIFILRSTGRRMILSMPLRPIQMSQELYDAISDGRADFLRDHKRFPEDITQAVERLENMLQKYGEFCAETSTRA